jgi:hypothetical protein
LIERLNRDFADILTEGKVRQTDPFPDEADDPDKLHLHRLVMRFNREDYARLRQMIDVINEGVDETVQPSMPERSDVSEVSRLDPKNATDVGKIS